MKKPASPQQIAMRRAFAAAKRIPNAPDPKRKERISIWADFVKAAMKDSERERST